MTGACAIVQDGHEAPSMADVNLGLGEWEGQGGGLRGHMECSLDVFDVAGAERFTSSFKVSMPDTTFRSTLLLFILIESLHLSS